MYLILVLNLGGTSSKLSIYQESELLVGHSIAHPDEEIRRRPLSSQQLDYRLELVESWLAQNGRTMDDFQAVAIRGATIREASRSGTYLVTGTYENLLMKLYIPEEPLVNGIRIITPLAIRLVGDRKIPIYITDPPSVDEMQPVAKVSGLEEYPRRGRLHALNQRAVARKHAAAIGKTYDQCRFVVAHLGGGVSVGAHCGGKIIDANDAGDGYGPFSTDRAGTVSTETMLDLCYDRGMTREQVYRHIRGEAGIYAHLGTRDMRKVERRMQQGDSKAELIYKAFVYQAAKEIGSMATVLKGRLDAILLTGGISHSKQLTAAIQEYVSGIAPVEVYPGEFENQALADGACRVLRGEEKAIIL